MKCESCKGKGSMPVYIEHTALGDLFVKQIHAGDEPCIDCGGTGFTHCCEGLQEQPDAGQTEH